MSREGAIRISLLQEYFGFFLLSSLHMYVSYSWKALVFM